MKANDIDVCRFEELVGKSDFMYMDEYAEFMIISENITAYLRQQQAIEDESAKCCAIVADGTKGLVTP